MPIYEYLCQVCGHALEVLQKLNDPVLVACPACAKPALKKQVSAAGFQLKGLGWYVTDFKNKGNKDNNDNNDSNKDKQKQPASTEAKSESAPSSESSTSASGTGSCGSGGCH